MGLLHVDYVILYLPSIEHCLMTEQQTEQVQVMLIFSVTI